MGTRANILIKSGDEQVCLYQHWDGDNLPEKLRKALKRGESRWNDYQYLTRIIFSEMICNEIDALTGYGISQKVYGGKNLVITVNMDKGTVQLQERSEVSFENFINNDQGFIF
jgi:hypothetical protein